MPIYEYECLSCRHQFEKKEDIEAPTTTRCPECGDKAQRKISMPAAIFRGGSPSAEKKFHRGRPIHQTEEGHWEEDGIMDRR